MCWRESRLKAEIVFCQQEQIDYNNCEIDLEDEESVNQTQSVAQKPFYVDPLISQWFSVLRHNLDG